MKQCTLYICITAFVAVSAVNTNVSQQAVTNSENELNKTSQQRSLGWDSIPSPSSWGQPEKPKVDQTPKGSTNGDLTKINFEDHVKAVARDPTSITKVGEAITSSIGNVFGLEDVFFNGTFFSTKFPSVLSYTNTNFQTEVAIRMFNQNTKGQLKLGFSNITLHQVYKLTISFMSQNLVLEHFEISMGSIFFRVLGLGKWAEDDSDIITEIIMKNKDTYLKLINTACKTMINMALQAAKGLVTDWGVGKL